MVETFRLETRKKVCNVVIDPRDMHCSKIKVMLQGVRSLTKSIISGTLD